MRRQIPLALLMVVATPMCAAILYSGAVPDTPASLVLPTPAVSPTPQPPEPTATPAPTPEPTTTKAREADAGEHCTASWYSMRRGAHGMQAAHKRPMPMGALLRVTAPDGRYVDVTVVDRGPFIRGRCVDLSREAFARLAPPGRGVIRDVTVQRLR